MQDQLKIFILFLIAGFIFIIMYSNNSNLILLLFLGAFVLIILYCCVNILDNIDDFNNNLNLERNNNIERINIDVVPSIIKPDKVKVNNIKDLHENFSNECCICLENIEPIDSFKLSNCNYHIYHNECLETYLEQNFTKCPICNI